MTFLCVDFQYRNDSMTVYVILGINDEKKESLLFADIEGQHSYGNQHRL